jgi:hypothetical protein
MLDKLVLPGIGIGKSLGYVKKNAGNNGNLLIPMNGISKFVKLYPATLFSTPLRGSKAQKVISHSLIIN